jgi:hypothetical protein
MVVLPDGKTVLWSFYLTVKLFYGRFMVVLPDGKTLCLDSLDKVNLQVSL